MTVSSLHGQQSPLWQVPPVGGCLHWLCWKACSRIGSQQSGDVQQVLLSNHSNILAYLTHNYRSDARYALGESNSQKPGPCKPDLWTPYTGAGSVLPNRLHASRTVCVRTRLIIPAHRATLRKCSRPGSRTCISRRGQAGPLRTPGPAAHLLQRISQETAQRVLFALDRRASLQPAREREGEREKYYTYPATRLTQVLPATDRLAFPRCASFALRTRNNTHLLTPLRRWG